MRILFVFLTGFLLYSQAFAENAIQIGLQNPKSGPLQLKLAYDYQIQAFHISPYMTYPTSAIEGKKELVPGDMNKSYGLGFAYDLFAFQSNTLGLALKYGQADLESLYQGYGESHHEVIDAGIRFHAPIFEYMAVLTELDYRYPALQELQGFQPSISLAFSW